MSTPQEATKITMAATIAREAIAVADELDQIRAIYGEDCLASVKRALHAADDLDWHGAIERAVVGWQAEHPRHLDDLIL